MNFCGGAVEHQVHEPPIVSAVRHHSPGRDLENERFHTQNDECHPAIQTPLEFVEHSSQPQTRNSSSNHIGRPVSNSRSASILRITKKKLQQPLASGRIGSSFTKRGNTVVSQAPPRSRSRSRSRSRRHGTNSDQDKYSNSNTKDLEDSMEGMEISTRQLSSSSPRMLNPISPQRLLGSGSPDKGRLSTAGGAANFSNMKTLDTLLKRLENGFRVKIHNGSDPKGKRVFLVLLQNRTSLLIRPIENDETSTPSVKFPVRTVLRLEIGKTKSSVLGRSIYDHIHPMTCFSIVVKLWSDAETYFDFEASSIIEREALISTLMVVLDQAHNNRNEQRPLQVNTYSDVPANNASATGLQLKGNSTIKSNIADIQNSNGKITESSGEVSPGKRTKIYSNTFFEGRGDEEQLGTEISLISPRNNDDARREPPETTIGKSPQNAFRDSCADGKPFHQRRVQPTVNDSQALLRPFLSSPSRSSRQQQSTRNFLGNKKPVPIDFSKRMASSPISTSPRKRPSPIDVEFVDKHERPGDSDLSGNANNEDGAENIMGLTHRNVTVADPEVGLHSPDDLQPDISFEISQQGLPVSKIKFSPTKETSDPQTGCCSLAPATMDQVSVSNGQAWCSDDICTLALKDIAETCTGIFDKRGSFRRDQADALEDLSSDVERACVEEYIADVLGGQACSVGGFFPDGDVWNVVTSKGGAAGGLVKLKANRIQNRASLLNAQATRLRTLRNEMTFAAALKRSKERMQYVQTTKSFDDADDMMRQAQERTVKSLHTSALMEKVMGSMVLGKPEEDEEVVYYDSDPEDVRPRTKGVRRALADRRNTIGNGKTERQSCPILSGVGFEKIAVGKKLRKLDESLIVEIVQAMRNETLTLMWHPTQSKANPNRSPVCVNLWIESGVYLVDGSFLLPRLSWSVAYENNLGAKKLNVSKAEPDQIDLLDVCRIRMTEKINRNLHPFPNPRKSFVVETQDEVYLFEAQTTDERNRIVYGYKLVIARLASLLMLRDSRAVEEFFGSASAMVPGGFTVGK